MKPLSLGIGIRDPKLGEGVFKKRLFEKLADGTFCNNFERYGNLGTVTETFSKQVNEIKGHVIARRCRRISRRSKLTLRTFRLL